MSYLRAKSVHQVQVKEKGDVSNSSAQKRISSMVLYHYNIIILSCMIWKLSYFFPVFSQILGKTLNLIWVWEFLEYLRQSLPSGLCCVMSYLMQSGKQYARTDSIKETE